MRKLVILAIVLCLAMMLIPAASAGPNGTDRPFKGTATGILQFGAVDNPDGLLNVKDCDEANVPGIPPEVVAFFQVTTFTTADGIASHLGKIHLEAAHCPNPFVGPVGGQMAFIAANGDVLYSEYYGTGPTSVHMDFLAENTQDECYLLNDVPCRSTGRFADVAGQAEQTVEFEQTDPDNPFVPWSFWADWMGELSY